LGVKIVENKKKKYGGKVRQIFESLEMLFMGIHETSGIPDDSRENEFTVQNCSLRWIIILPVFSFQKE
jgi:hypothetical protein